MDVCQTLDELFKEESSHVFLETSALLYVREEVTS